jgi:hypothetical protein
MLHRMLEMVHVMPVIVAQQKQVVAMLAAM